MILALLLAAAPFRADAVEVPGALEQLRIPESLRALGVPVTLRAVRSKEKPDALIQHFGQLFEKAGLFVPADGELHSAGDLIQVTGFDVVHRNSVSVLLQPNPDGTTTVILGEAYLHAGKKDAPQPGFAPVFPGAVGLIQSSLETGQSLAYGAKATPDELTAFYRETLGADGFRETAPGVFEKKGARVRLWLKPRGAETGVVLIRNAK